MCYNIAVEATRARFQKEFGWDTSEGWALSERLNAFTHPFTAVLIMDNELKHWVMASWGLVPPWLSKNPGAERKGTLNARWETLDEKPSFKEAYRKSRAAIPVTGFWEWEKGLGEKKQLVKIDRKGETFFLAGLVQPWYPKDEQVWTFTVITMPAFGWFTGIHNRMPLALTQETAELWLKPGLPDRDSVSETAKRQVLDWRKKSSIESGRLF